MIPECEQLLAFIHELRVLAAQARQRGDARVMEPSPGYWYGVQFGYEDAAQRLEEVLARGDRSRLIKVS
jgi:hypothetical protein